LLGAVARTALDSALAAVVASIDAASPRVLAVGAPPGFRKTAILNAYGARIGRLVTCDLVGAVDGIEPARAITDALLRDNPARAAAAAADRLTLRADDALATERESLRREWPVAGPPEVFALRDSDGVLATPRGAELVAELIGAVPPTRVVALVTRAALPPALQQIVGRERTVTLGIADLALRAADVLELARSSGVPDTFGEAVHALAGGWPLATELLLRLIRFGPADEVLDAASAVAAEALLTFAIHRTIAGLADVVRDAVTVAAILRGASRTDLVRVLGAPCDDAVFGRLASLPLINTRDDRFVVHPVAATLLRERFAPFVQRTYERTLRVLTGDGAYVDAATVAIEAGDPVRAAAIIDAAPPYTTAPVPLGAYERVIDRLNRNLITRYPNIWVATIPYRAFSVEPTTYVREAETVYYCLPANASPDQRAAIVMLLASAYVNIGRPVDADTVLQEALDGFAREHGGARAAILHFVASLRGIDGRFSIARALAAEATNLAPDAFGESQTLHYIDSHEAAYRGKQDRVVVIIDELLRRRGRVDMPLYLAYVAVSGAIFSWVNGDDAAFERYLRTVEDAVTPGLEVGFAPIIDAARGRPSRSHPRDEDRWPAFAAVAQLFRIGTATDDGEALDAARTAARNADLRGDPYLQLLAHAALHVLDPDRAMAEAEVLRGVVARIESAELHAAIQGLLDGGPAGMLEPFVRHRIARGQRRPTAHVAIELLAGRVVDGETVVRMTDKEFELLALLASTHGTLSRDRIGEALWDHLDPEEWRNNFKVTVYRIRKKLAPREIVLADGGGFRLAPSVDVDMRRAEAVVRRRAGEPLDEAARAYLTSVLDSYRSSAVARYDRYAWGQQLTARIVDVVSAAGVAVAADARARDLHEQALVTARRVREIDPFNEAACELVVRELVEHGDVDGARHEYRRFAAALAAELGAAPARRLADLIWDR